MEDLAKAFGYPTEDANRGKKRPKNTTKKEEKERRTRREDIIGRIWGTSRLQKPPRPDGDPACYLNQDLNTDLSKLFFFKRLKKEKQNELSKFVYNGGVNVIANVLSNMLKYSLREKDPMEKEIPWDKYMASAINSRKKTSIQTYYEVCKEIEQKNELIVDLQRKLALIDDCLIEVEKATIQCAEEQWRIDTYDSCAEIEYKLRFEKPEK